MGSIKEHFVAKYKDDVNQTLYMFLEKEKGAAAGSNSLIVLNKQFYVGGYKEQFVRHLIYDLSTIQKTIKRIVLSFFLKFCHHDTLKLFRQKFGRVQSVLGHIHFCPSNRTIEDNVGMPQFHRFYRHVRLCSRF